MNFPSLPPLLWLLFSGVFFATGEYLSKKFILQPSSAILVLLLLMYCLGALAWLPALMRLKDLSIVGSLWSVISLCLTVLIGILLFGERLTFLKIIGIGLAILSVVILSFA